MLLDAELHSHRRNRTKSTAAKLQKKPAQVEVPANVQQALRNAMKSEGVPGSQFDDLLWIMQHESGGRVGVRNTHSSARGLFQLLKAQYGLNPNGESSFGNAEEECRGGIRYVMSRYHSAAAARAFWEKHGWY